MLETSLLELEPLPFVKKIYLLDENKADSKYFDKPENCSFVLGIPFLVLGFNPVTGKINNDKAYKKEDNAEKVIRRVRTGILQCNSTEFSNIG